MLAQTVLLIVALCLVLSWSVCLLLCLLVTIYLDKSGCQSLYSFPFGLYEPVDFSVSFYGLSNRPRVLLASRVQPEVLPPSRVLLITGRIINDLSHAPSPDLR